MFTWGGVEYGHMTKVNSWAFQRQLFPPHPPGDRGQLYGHPRLGHLHKHPSEGRVTVQVIAYYKNNSWECLKLVDRGCGGFRGSEGRTQEKTFPRGMRVHVFYKRLPLG